MSLVTFSAPDFTESAVFSDGTITDGFNFKEYIKNQVAVLFFWPMDFTFVCPSELISLNNFFHKFESRKVKIIGVSIDSVFVHSAWRNTNFKDGGIGNVKYVMVSDIKRNIQKEYKIEHPSLGVALRASFVIDEKGIIRHQVVNDLPFGRNIKELLRIIDSMEHFKMYGEVCPANWKKGKKGMIPTTTGMKKFLSKHASSL